MQCRSPSARAPGTALTDICLALFRRNRLGSEDEPAVQSETMLPLETGLEMLLCVIPYNSQGSDSVLLKSKISGKLVVGYNECVLYRAANGAVEKVSSKVHAQGHLWHWSG